MPPEVKYLGDGSAVLVLGEATPRTTSTDGGRTTTEIDQVYVARLATEEIEADAVLDERPTFDEETQTWIQAGAEPDARPAAGTPSGATDLPVTHSRGEAQTAEQLQAEIDRLRDEKAALEAAPPATEEPAPPGEHTST